VKLLNPLSIVDVGLAAGNVLHVSRVDEDNLEAACFRLGGNIKVSRDRPVPRLVEAVAILPSEAIAHMTSYLWRFANRARLQALRGLTRTGRIVEGGVPIMRTGSRWRTGRLLLLAALASGCGAEVGAPIRIDEPVELLSYDSAPAWSPDGSRIAYRRRRGSPSTLGIWIVDTAGVATHEVLHGAWESPDWSPDGTRLAISYIGIYSVKPTGDSLQAITTKGFTPRWSPDGNELAFQNFDNSIGSIGLVSRDGTGLRSLAPTGGIESWLQPDWSPDGARLVHVRRPSPEEIFVMDTTGHAEQRLTTDEYSDGDPAWSPDGQWIAWTSQRQAGSEIWLMKPDGTGAHALTLGYSASWSPDSRRIAFARTISNTALLFAIDLETLRIRQITQ
jgi:Tol biopolymer transport system component